MGVPGIVILATPAMPRGAVALPVEGDRWIVTLSGTRGGEPTADADAFADFALSLGDPVIGELIKDAEPLTDPVPMRFPASQRRRYEQLVRFPEGFLVTGDALCSFNPIYAQGMTVAAMTAVALDDALNAHRQRSGGELAGLTRGFQRQVARTNAGAWTMATSEDLRYPWTEGARPDLATRIMHRYADRVLEVANGNPGVNTAFVDVINLRRPPASLFRPRVLLPVLARRRAPPLTGPPV
jgi:2-polyprenyl-6-methoxyphenol hydroxylase-like FAD-dependent oxidoreductase